MAEIKKTRLTREGYEAYQNELIELESKRTEIAEALKSAIAQGDLSENAEYDEAKNDQALLEARINDVKAILSNAEVIDEDGLEKTVVTLGSKIRVEVSIDKSKEIKEYKIVGSNEANPKMGFISDESVVGKSLLGLKTGKKVKIDVPAGIYTYKVLEIL